MRAKAPPPVVVLITNQAPSRPPPTLLAAVRIPGAASPFPLVTDTPITIPTPLNPWGAAVDGLGGSGLSVQEIGRLALGQNLTQSPAYRASNPPSYLEAMNRQVPDHFGW